MRLSAAINAHPEKCRAVFTPAVLAELRNIVDLREGHEDTPLTTRTLGQRCEGVEVLLTSWGALRIDREILAHCPDLKLVVHCAGSVRTIVSDALLAMPTTLTSAAALNSVPVARYTLGLILCALRDAFSWRDIFHREGPSKWWFYAENAVAGYARAKIGIYEFGRIARTLLELLKAFDFDVYVASDYFSEEDAVRYRARKASLEWIMAHCEVVSLHAAETPQNHQIINRTLLRTMRDGAHLINTSRGSLIHEGDLAEELERGRLHAYLDVLREEPPPPDHPLLHLPNCQITPHIAGSARREKESFGFFGVEEIRRFITDRPLQGLVQRDALGTIA